MEFQVPDFSLRYAAVASGLGAFGWSGPKEKRRELVKLLHSSGVVIRLEDGTEKAVSPEEMKEA